MIKSTLNVIANLFQGRSLSEDEAEELFNEAVLMTLARASDVDTNINPIEVSLVQEKVKEVTGQEVSAADVRVAANSDLFERTSLENCLRRVQASLPVDQKVMIVSALLDVVRVDETVTFREVDFFNMVVNALRLRPSDLMGLIEN